MVALCRFSTTLEYSFLVAFHVFNTKMDSYDITMAIDLKNHREDISNIQENGLTSETMTDTVAA